MANIRAVATIAFCPWCDTRLRSHHEIFRAGALRLAEVVSPLSAGISGAGPKSSQLYFTMSTAGLELFAFVKF
jgi:hypothetical protein